MAIHDKRIRETILYENNDIHIDRDCNGRIFFELTLPVSKKVYTSDPLEAAAILITHKHNLDDLRAIRLSRHDLYHCKPDNALYWLTGGDFTWKTGLYKSTWHNCADMLMHKFGWIFVDTLQSIPKTFGDLFDTITIVDPKDILEFMYIKKLVDIEAV